MKLSIIIPVYNAERYIEQMVSNVIRQISTQDELILVDDGSLDNSLELCLKMADSNPCVHVVHQENGGPSKARNTGISISHGDYVLFLDADDNVTDDWLSSIRAYIREYAVDVFCFGYSTVRNDYRGEIDMCPDFALFPDAESVKQNMSELIDSFYFNVVWNKVYKRQMLIQHAIIFDESLYIGEDRKFCLNVISACSSWCMIPKSLYRYIIQNTSSISMKCDLGRLKQMLTVNREYRTVLKMTNLPINVQNARYEYEQIKICTSHLMDLVRSDSKNKYNYCKKLHKKYEVRFNKNHVQQLYGVQKLTYRIWTSQNTWWLYAYVYLLSIYKYKLKLFKESDRKL
jgi:glycosyltransferase involved in cell wall biosynthesis